MKGHQAAKFGRNSARKVKGAKTAKTISECGDSALAVDVHGKAYVSIFSDSVRKPPHAFVQTAPFIPLKGQLRTPL
jgi:hypothetical protein